MCKDPLEQLWTDGKATPWVILPDKSGFHGDISDQMSNLRMTFRGKRVIVFTRKYLQQHLFAVGFCHLVVSFCNYMPISRILFSQLGKSVIRRVSYRIQSHPGRRMSRNYSGKQEGRPLANHECFGPDGFDLLPVLALGPLSQYHLQLAFVTGEETAFVFIQSLAWSLAIVIASLATRQF